MRIIRAPMILLVLTFPFGSVNGKDFVCVVSICDECDQESTLTVALSSAQQGARCVYTVDRPASAIDHYSVSRNISPRRASLEVVPGQVSESVRSKIQAALSVWSSLRQLGDATELQTLSPRDHFDSAIDLLDKKERQERVAEALNGYLNDSSTGNLNPEIVRAILGVGNPVGSVYRLRFPDQSSVLYSISNVSENSDSALQFELHFRPEASVDGEGFPLPHGPAQLIDRGMVRGASASQYKEYAERIGVSIQSECEAKKEIFFCTSADADSASTKCTYNGESVC